jgi:hypothetical protein
MNKVSFPVRIEIKLEKRTRLDNVHLVGCAYGSSVPPSVEVYVADAEETASLIYRKVAEAESKTSEVQIALHGAVGTHMKFEFSKKPARTNKNPNG